MKIHTVQIQNFTAFRDFSLECGEGLNVAEANEATHAPSPDARQ